MVAIDADSRISEWNRAAETLLACPRDSMIGQSLESAHPALGEAARKAGESSDGQLAYALVRVEHGALAKIRVSMSRALDETGASGGAVLALSMAADGEGDADLPLGGETGRLIADTMSDVVSLHDLDGRILFVSPSVERAAGYPPAEITGMDAYLFVHPDDRERVRARLAENRQGKAARVEWRRLSKDGSYRWCETESSPILDASGAPARIACATRDITERRVAESALRKTNKRLSNVLESISEAFFVVDRQWRFSFVNARAVALVRRKRDQLIGNLVWDVFPTVRETRGWEAVEKAMYKQISATVEELIPAAGIWVRSQIFPSQDGVSVYIQDITEERTAQEALQHSLSRLQRSVTGIAQAMAFAVEIRDPYTAGHQRRVAALAGAIARQLGMSPEEVSTIRMAGLLHDIGKIAIPAEIMCKPGKLMEAEFSIIRTHARMGYDILKGIDFDGPVALVALQHHERMDGSGYPQGLAGDQMEPESRIMAIADVVEAMASHRPYRPALGLKVALDEIVAGRDRLFDPAGVDACLAALAAYSYDLELLIRLETEGQSDLEIG
jgi:PAS domain S-box-containing protein/putative nucleotidyltransferase with HDIG domain